MLSDNAMAQKIEYQIHSHTGALQEIKIQNDTTGMNWLVQTDGKQYPWINEESGWGLGDMTLAIGGKEVKRMWTEHKNGENTNQQSIQRYDLREIEVAVFRYMKHNNLIEEYEFKNKTNSVIRLKDIAINTPFNDNYPDAITCYHSRTNAHVWAGNSGAYVNAMRMGAFPPHLGLVLTEGSIKSYEIRQRSHTKGLLNTRGIIALNPEDVTLQPYASYKLSWMLFSHAGQEDFYNKLIEYGSIIGKSEKYVYEKGQTASVEFSHNGHINNPTVYVNGEKVTCSSKGNKITVKYKTRTEGDLVFTLNYNTGKSTSVKCLVISGEKELIDKRVNFIIDKQQFKNDSDPRNGAYLVYDNENQEIFLNAQNRSDCNEGRERIGMGILLALQYQKTKSPKIKESLLKYYDFVRKLQDDDYKTYSDVSHKGRHRPYNYPWIANFYFQMFNVTGNKKNLLDGYHTLKALYRNFGHSFYAIDTPTDGYELLKKNGLDNEAQSLLADFTELADNYLKTGWCYPKSEVNYEQSIVAPSVVHLLRVYLITKDKKYLDGAKRLLPLLESFASFQPDYHMNEIAIRHWDGYWFGKYRLWGDTFVHYWSTITAVAYNLYARSTGNISYQKRAKNIIRNNLCQFFEDGSASCAFIYPDKINGENAHLFDPYANDQDWAMVFYFYVNQDFE